jgi:hypothetical protein
MARTFSFRRLLRGAPLKIGGTVGDKLQHFGLRKTQVRYPPL